jgi:Tfp pilus assembly protein FimT
MTLLELVVAITVTAILCIVLSTAYINLYRQYHRQISSAQSIHEALAAKARVDNVFRRCQRIQIDGENRVRVFGVSDSTGQTVQCRESALLLDDAVLVRDVHGLAVSASTPQQADAPVAFTWEFTMVHGGWVGGAVLLGNP